MIVKVPQMETCSWCGGYGLRHSGEGDVIDCHECGGGGVVEARDERGRFLPWLVIVVEEPEPTA
jgi:DnaJ-class molecular chaperone